MSHHRTARLNEQLKRDISFILSRKVRDPRVGSVLVTEARLSSDHSVARVFVRSMSQDVGVNEVMAGLAAAAPFIRRELGRVLHLRRVPELRFEHDTTLDSARRIEVVLREVLPEEDAGSDGPEDSGPGDGAGEGRGKEE
jgi:ribosome-binding factor A